MSDNGTQTGGSEPIQNPPNSSPPFSEGETVLFVGVCVKMKNPMALDDGEYVIKFDTDDSLKLGREYQIKGEFSPLPDDDYHAGELTQIDFIDPLDGENNSF